MLWLYDYCSLEILLQKSSLPKNCSSWSFPDKVYSGVLLWAHERDVIIFGLYSAKVRYINLRKAWIIDPLSNSSLPWYSPHELSLVFLSLLLIPSSSYHLPGEEVSYQILSYYCNSQSLIVHHAFHYCRRRRRCCCFLQRCCHPKG